MAKSTIPLTIAAELAEQIDRQRAIVAELQAKGQDASLAVGLLRTFTDLYREAGFVNGQHASKGHGSPAEDTTHPI